MFANPESSSQFDISEQEMEKLVGEVIRYILFKTEQTSGCPIRREDLTQLISAKGYRQRNLPAFVINEAKFKLSSIFGYDLLELQRSRSSAASGRSSQSQQPDAKTYVIMSKLPPEVFSKYVEDTKSSHMKGITFAVVGIVQLSGGKIAEENLCHHMKRLGLNENEANNPDSVSIKLALETLLHQRYLQKEKVNGPDGNIWCYQLAERALEKSFHDRIKEYVSQMIQNDEVPSQDD